MGIPRILRGMVRPPLLVLLGLSTAALAVPIDRLGARSEREVSPRHAEDDLERRGSKMSHVPIQYRCTIYVPECSSMPQKQKRVWDMSKKAIRSDEPNQILFSLSHRLSLVWRPLAQLVAPARPRAVRVPHRTLARIVGGVERLSEAVCGERFAPSE